ncbi:putative ribonuclease H-like domain-containing protein [Tanacetum coccineum]
MAISSSSSSSSSDNKVQNCSKQCLESFKCLQKNYDTEREKHNKAKLEIRGYEIALESLESRIIGHEKNELAWGEKYEFQNYELKCREIKINNLNLELEKAIKERDELKDKIAKWEESSKNLDEILNSQMSARDKTGLGYSTQLNELSSNHETDSENSFSVFDGRSSDEESTPANDRSSKADGYKAVPPPITGNFLTPRADISFAGLDEYAIRNKIIESQTSKLNNKTSETTSQINDANTIKPKSSSESVVSNPQINRDRVIIEDWNSDDEEEVSTEHLIKDCNFHDKKSQESKLKNVVNTGKREGKPVWDNTKRVNHQNFSKYPHLSETFVPSGVLTKTGLHRPSASTASPSINTARLVCTARSSINTVRPNVSTARPSVSTARPSISTAKPVCTARPSISSAKPVYASRPIYPRIDNGNPEILLQDHAVVDSGCSSHMTGNKAYLSDYEDFNGGFVAFGSDPKGGKITGKGKIKTANLDFDDVYFVDELKFNLFSISQMCDKKNSVLFTESECLILSPSFKLLDESQVVLRAPRKDDVYSLDLKNIVPSGGITCLYANATADESKLWHKRLGHVNFKNINKLVKGHLVRGLPSKVFVNDHTCVACKKDKQHKASCKAKLERIIRKPLELLHMDLFGPVFVESINKKRCDNGTEFKNYAMNEFCAKKGIKREFSVARTPQQNGVAERKNRTLIEASLESVSRLTFTYPILGRGSKSPSISFMRPFGCPLTILNTLDSLGKFDGKSDKGYLLGYSTFCKAFRVYNKRTKRVKENMHINFLKDQPNVGGTGPNWMFDLDFLTNSMNYIPVSVENQVNMDADSEDIIDKEGQHQMPEDEQVLQDEIETMVTQELVAKAMDDVSRQAFEEEKRRIASQKKAAQATSKIPIDASTLPNADLPIDLNMLNLEDASDTLPNDGIFNEAYDDEDVGAVADFNNMDNTIAVSPIPILRIHKDHLKGQILADPALAVQTRGKIQKASLVQ